MNRINVNIQSRVRGNKSWNKKESVGKALSDELLPKQVVRKIEMLNDNKTSLTLTRDPVSQNCTKHIDVTDAPSCARSGRRRRTRN